VLLVDERAPGCRPLAEDLRRLGFEATSSLVEVEPVAAVVVATHGADAGLPPCARSGDALRLPVIVVADEMSPEARLRAAIDGAVCVVSTSAGAAAVASALEAALAADAPEPAEQRRRARIAALEGLARSENGAAGTRVHLTRLEHGPVRSLPAMSTGPLSALATCTPKQRELLETIARNGGVAKAAVALGMSRSSVYATLRRIAHRLHLRDGGELLRLLGAGDRPRLRGS
jgi:DNA-binding CsgD family transcriptional regulator